MEERFPSPTDLDAIRLCMVIVERAIRRKNHIPESTGWSMVFLMGYATNLREVTKWPEHMLQKKRDMEER